METLQISFDSAMFRISSEEEMIAEVLKCLISYSRSFDAEMDLSCCCPSLTKKKKKTD